MLQTLKRSLTEGGARHRPDVRHQRHGCRRSRAHDVLPGGGRRAAHQGRRRPGRRLRERQPGHQGQGDLRRQLQRRADQGPGGTQGRPAGPALGHVLDRHLRADRAGRDRRLRRHRRDRGGEGLAHQVLSGADGERGDRRQDLGHPVPALDHRHVLQQGRLPGGRTGPGEAAGNLGGAGRHGQAAGQDRRLGPGRPLGRDDPLDRLSLLDVRRALHAERPGADERQTATRPIFSDPDVVGALQFWLDLGQEHKVMPKRHHRMGHAAPELPGAGRPP